MRLTQYLALRTSDVWLSRYVLKAVPGSFGDSRLETYGAELDMALHLDYERPGSVWSEICLENGLTIIQAGISKKAVVFWVTIDQCSEPGETYSSASLRQAWIIRVGDGFLADSGSETDDINYARVWVGEYPEPEDYVHLEGEVESLASLPVPFFEIELDNGEALEIWRLPNGALVGIDSTYADQVSPTIQDPYTPGVRHTLYYGCSELKRVCRG